VRSSNPVLTRLTPETQQGAAAPAYGYGAPSPYQVVTPSVAAGSDRMTLDDVVVKTVMLLGITALSGLATAILLPPELRGPVWILAAMAGLAVGLFISFKRVASPPLIVTYAVIEGAFLGAVSAAYNDAFQGIVLQAALGTFGIFFVMAALYRARVIRNSPRFARIITGAMAGILVILLGNLLLSLFGVNTHLRDGSGLAIIFSLVIIVVAALSFVLDFDLIEQGIAQGAPRSTSWIAAFGLLVGLIWVYLEVLRLLSYLRGRD
jgi:uncharacterized YccA/Bax inhibitor family protein